ncbi:DUF6691 family protein [Oricola sp.]|uniref:DUF6691 family protein n=1 Tax=Oricola sp. TaxID=1979950 RepID=UPI003BAC2871
MVRFVSALLIGVIFGIGIALSGMANPAKVQNFFDVAGTWDPSLIFVMGGALVTAAIGYRLLFATRDAPLLERSFVVPSSRTIDARLVGGSALFGIGWGISGFCPGGAIPAIGLGYLETLVFMSAMIAGMVIARTLNMAILKPTAA